MDFLDKLAARRRFGMRAGLGNISRLLSELGDPQLGFDAVHVAGTNGKGAVSAILDSCLRSDAAAKGGAAVIGRYTSPHLVDINERFVIGGRTVDDGSLEAAAAAVEKAIDGDVTFFEALTAVAFRLFADNGVSTAVVECGLGGRLDATNVCRSSICVITRVGLDHCGWLGSGIAEIAAEKAGIVKPAVPVVLGRNDDVVRMTVEKRAKELGSPFYYAPQIAAEDEIPADFSLDGSFNRENALTALAALKVMGAGDGASAGFGKVVWPGRFQRIGNAIVDGAHNPPAAKALAQALSRILGAGEKVNLVCGFCKDKDIGGVLSVLSPLVARGYAVVSSSQRSAPASEVAEKMLEAGIDASVAGTLSAALERSLAQRDVLTVVCGSLFLAGDALVELGAAKRKRAYPSEAVEANEPSGPFAR